jgi:ubiquinone biosynthesis monooxygenase Coq7
MLKKRFPTDASVADKIASIIRVDHAGEYGAVQIYKGQLQGARSQALRDQLQPLLDQEQKHKLLFEDLLKQHQVRPTLFQPLWHVGGYALGYLTARLGDKAAWACTVAIEEVIDGHYASQEKMLAEDSAHQELYHHIHQCRLDEMDHKEQGLSNGAEQAPAYFVLSTVIKGITKGAIFLSKRI